MKTLEQNIKDKKFSNIYLIFGTEDYLKDILQKKLIENVVSKELEMMNFDIFESKNISISQILDACNTMPFMNEYRLIIVKNSGLFSDGRKNDSEDICAYLKNIPKTTILTFIEEKVDKRQKLFKEVKKIGVVDEINTLSENELSSWIIKIFNENNKTITPKETVYMLRNIGFNMETLLNEINKLVSFKSDSVKISIEDIDNICTKSIESKIFDLISAISNKNLEKSLSMYKNLIFNKTSPFLVLNMMARQFRIILQVKYLNAKNYNLNQIASELNLRDFMVREALAQSKNFTNKDLLNALNDCLETDSKIKTGALVDIIAVEMLIIQYSNK